MMRRQLWEELGPSWPLDHWVRRAGRKLLFKSVEGLATAAAAAPASVLDAELVGLTACDASCPHLQDHWMRDEEVSKGRECVCPEINRNKNIGEVRRAAPVTHLPHFNLVPPWHCGPTSCPCVPPPCRLNRA